MRNGGRIVRRPAARFQVGSGTKTIEVHIDKSDRIDSWSSRAASWAQVLTLIMVVVGYFYTVVPAFQKERLSEEVARLEMERDKSSSDIKANDARIVGMRRILDQMKLSKDQLQAENASLLGQQKSLLASAALADHQRLEANRLLAIEKQRLGQTNDLYINAVRDRYLEDYEMSLFALVSDPAVSFSGDKSEKDLVGTITKSTGNTFGRLGDLVESLSSKYTDTDDSGEARAYKKVSAEFRSQFLTRKSNIIISEIDADLWASAFIDRLSKARAGESKCADAYWDGLAESRKWTRSQLDQVRHDASYGPKQDQAFQRTCSVMANYSIERSFSDAWHEYYKEYVRRLSSVPQAITKDTPMEAFPDQLLQPPEFTHAWLPKKEDLRFTE